MMLAWIVSALQLVVALLVASQHFDIGGKKEWTPQCGNTIYPKTTLLSSVARKGNIFEICQRLYHAKSDFDVGPVECSPDGDNLPGKLDENLWQELEIGSLLAPIRLNKRELRLKTGDIVYDENERKYYRAMENGIIFNGRVDKHLLELDNEALSDWMAALRPVIGEQRLGDIIIAGTHDSGSWNITDDSYIVDRNFLYQLAEIVTPEVLTNWSKTQTENFSAQLTDGFRTLDLRVADMETEDGSFRWWHGVTGDRIEDGLWQIANFCRDHPQEVLILGFQHFVMPGNVNDSTLPIPDNRKDELSDIILSYLGPYMAPKSLLTDNPTMNEVLATGTNVIATMEDDYIQAKDDRYWPVVMVSNWTGVSNPEDLFVERSSLLRTYREFHADNITDISGCITADEKNIVAALMTVYGNTSEFHDLIEVIAPGLLQVTPEQMSFEGLFLGLVSTARYGTNTDGMWARPAELYSSGASAHYHGTEEMLPYWIARPGVYKVNTIYTDDTPSSTLVDVAVSANRGDIGRATAIHFQGNSLDGYYIWNGFETEGGQAAQNCTASLARYRVISVEFPLDETWKGLLQKTTANFVEGFYPPDAEVQLQVSGLNSTAWVEIFVGNIQLMIDTTEDIYLRGNDFVEDASGFAYTSNTYNLFGPPNDCRGQPDSGYLSTVQWGNK